MGIKDGCAAANIATKIAFFIILLADVVNWIAFCTTSWYVGTNVDFYTGLWRTCLPTPFNPGCFMLDGTSYDKMNAIQAFAIFGFMALNVGFLLIVLYMFFGSCKGNSETGLASAITLFCSAAFWLISVAIFGSDWENGGGRFGYSYALAVCALILALIGGILMLIGGRGNTTVLTK